MKSTLKVVGLAAVLVMVLGATAQQVVPIRWGTYTPTVTNQVGLDSVTPTTTQYLRIGPAVIVWSSVTVDASVASTVSFDMTIPIASAFSAVGDAGGCASFNGATAERGLAISANTTDDEFSFQGVFVNTSAKVFPFIAVYWIVP